jgi:hypothetical protein
VLRWQEPDGSAEAALLGARRADQTAGRRTPRRLCVTRSPQRTVREGSGSANGADDDYSSIEGEHRAASVPRSSTVCRPAGGPSISARNRSRSVNFLQLQTAVMGTRFDESQRGDVRRWINATYWRVWTLEEWTFRYATESVTVTTGSKNVTGLTGRRRDRPFVPAWRRRRHHVARADRLPALYNDPRVGTGLPEAYTIINGVVSVGPASSETASDYLIVYEKEYTALANDGDTPLLPAGCHEDVLVFGAIARGLKTENDFTWQFFQQTADDGIDTLRRGYLTNRRDTNQSFAGRIRSRRCTRWPAGRM